MAQKRTPIWLGYYLSLFKGPTDIKLRNAFRKGWNAALKYKQRREEGLLRKARRDFGFKARSK